MNNIRLEIRRALDVVIGFAAGVAMFWCAIEIHWLLHFWLGDLFWEIAICTVAVFFFGGCIGLHLGRPLPVNIVRASDGRAPIDDAESLNSELSA